MAISLSSYKIGKQKQATAERMAKIAAAEQKKAGERGFWSNMLGGVGGKVLGAAIGGALSIASGGLLMPLVMAGSTMLAKKGAQELTKGLGMGADPSKIVGDEYGFGKVQAKSLREGLEQQIAASEEIDVGKELLGSYTSAFAAGKLGGVKGALKKIGTGEKGGWMQALGAGKEYGTSGGVAGAGEALSDLFGVGTKETVAKDIPHAELDLTQKELLESSWTPTGLVSEEETLIPLGDLAATEPLTQQELLESAVSPAGLVSEEAAVSPVFTQGMYEQPSWSTTMFPENKEQGGLVQDKRPTISDYFGMQGVSLGGSNKQSLAEMLGRK